MAELEHFDLDTDKDRVPVTILTGFLGAGKTTLFNHILTASHGKKIAVIQNEFGEVGIDDRLMAKNTKFQSDEEIVEVLNGCVCCSVRSDLVNIIKKLAARAKAGKLFLDGIVIETTGMADPGPVAQTFLTDPEIRAYARVDGVVTLVDAKHVMQHLDEKKADGAINESVCQVAFADRLLLNKVDLVPSEKELQTVEARLRSINAFAPIQRCTRSNVSVDRVLDIRGFDLSRALERDPGFLDPKRAPTKHDALVSSHSIDQGAARHLRGVKTGELDLMLTQEWIGSLLEERGADIYRMKGVLAIAHSNRRFVFHAVHMNMDGSFEAPWADGEPRESKLVFIGKGLDPKALNEAFNSCLDSPELTAERLAALRFAIGDTVECNTGEGEWATGEIVQLMYRDDGMPPGMIAPYQVRLSDGECIYAPSDDDCIVRKPRRRSHRLRELGSGADLAEPDAHGGCGGGGGPPDQEAEPEHGNQGRKRGRRGREHDHDEDGHEDGHVHDEDCGHLEVEEERGSRRGRAHRHEHGHH